MSALADGKVTPVGRLRRIHLGMIDAVLAGGGVAPVAALAAAQLNGTVTIVLPAVDVAVSAPALDEGRSAALARSTSERLLGRPVKVPHGLVAEVPVRSGDELLGYVALLDAAPGPDAHEILELDHVELEELLSGSWRLVLSSAPVQLRALVDSTVGPAGELVETLRAYFQHGANMNATAAAV